jgi:chromate reductase, NAD(P)H dehydrogenase (quinone)
MAHIVVLPGSHRAGSYNLSLARAAVALAPADHRYALETIRDIPLYDGDSEAAVGIPPAVTRLKDAVAAADGLLLVTPEYNNSMPGAFKNALDWMSRPPKDSARVFRNKPVGLIGATPGMGGTRLAQNAWLPVLRALGLQLWSGGSLFVSGADKVFDAEGALTDTKVRELLEKYLQGFSAFVAPGSAHRKT